MTRPPPVLGDNISQVIDRLIFAGGLKGKDEFETTEQYEARRKAGAAKNGTLVFVLPPDAPGLIYSADAQEMKIYLRTRHTFFDDDGGLNSGNTFVIRSTLVSKGPYVGTNAFGVKRLIRSTVSKDRGVFVDPASPVRLNEIFTTFTFSMDTEDARLLKPFLRVALVGKLTESRVYSSKDRHSPTVTEPWDSVTDSWYIPLLLEELRVFDSRTGEVVTRFTPDMEVGK